VTLDLRQSRIPFIFIPLYPGGVNAEDGLSLPDQESMHELVTTVMEGFQVNFPSSAFPQVALTQHETFYSANKKQITWGMYVHAAVPYMIYQTTDMV
jgi:hypothetical protein